MKINFATIALRATRSLLVVVVGLVGIGVCGAIISAQFPLWGILMFVAVGLYAYGLPSTVGIYCLLWTQDFGILGKNKIFVLLSSALIGGFIGFIATVVSPLMGSRFDLEISLLASLGGSIGGLFSGILCVKKLVAEQSLKLAQQFNGCTSNCG